MIHGSLVQIQTRDKVSLAGFFVKPKKRLPPARAGGAQAGTHRAILFIHGLGSNFYGGMPRLEALASAATRAGIALASFNTRGHDTVSGFAKGKRRILGGAGFEDFKESLYDIEAAVSFLARGYKEIFLVGHSTGASKALYYMYKRKDRRVKGLALAGPMSDLVGQRKYLGRKFAVVYHNVLKIARNKKRAGLPLPTEIFIKRALKPTIMSANRYLSLFTPGSVEDVFPYSDPKAQWKELKSARVPLLVLIGTKDKYRDRPAHQLVKIFGKNTQNTKKFTGVALAGSDHGMIGKRKEFAKAIVSWIKKI